ncbi:unnamed protein product [Laminaria digitata]
MNTLKKKKHVFGCEVGLQGLVAPLCFSRVRWYFDNTSALNIAGNRSCSLLSQARHLAVQYFFIQDLIKGGRRSIIHYVKTADRLAAIGTEHLSKQKRRYLLELIIDSRTWSLTLWTTQATAT